MAPHTFARVLRWATRHVPFILALDFCTCSFIILHYVFCRSTPASLLASPHSPTPPTPFIDPAATALGLHDPEHVGAAHSRMSRAPIGELAFDSFSTPQDAGRHLPRRSAGMDYDGDMGLLDETPEPHHPRGERYGDAFECENDDDLFSLPSLSQTPAVSRRYCN